MKQKFKKHIDIFKLESYSLKRLYILNEIRLFKFGEQNPHKFNILIFHLLRTLLLFFHRNNKNIVAIKTWIDSSFIEDRFFVFRINFQFQF